MPEIAFGGGFGFAIIIACAIDKRCIAISNRKLVPSLLGTFVIYTRQVGAIQERILTNGGDRIGDGDAYQVDAFIKRIVIDFVVLTVIAFGNEQDRKC